MPTMPSANVVCSCLNVSAGAAESKESKDSKETKEPPDLPDHPFFKKKLALVSDGGVRCAEPALAEGHDVGEWTVFSCLLCRETTHACRRGSPRTMLLNLELACDEETAAARRRDPELSPAFGLIVPKAEPPAKTPGHPAAAELTRRLDVALRQRLEAIEEETRLFREAKFLEFESFRERARSDYGSILGVLSAVRPPPVPEEPSGRPIVPSVRPRVDTGERPPARRPRPAAEKSAFDQKEDSLDSEGIFDLEGMDSSASPHDDLDSDAYDSDDDDSVSKDEGIQIQMKSSDQEWKSTIAKSLPVNVPNFAQYHEQMAMRQDQNVEDPQDIAASIKALARSVHGDVFGDLPRPRFSTQI